MLEIRNVTKIYRSKTGLEVKALDNVSVTFPETGMVFILGKSGSGKSTMLNVIGGLDGCDAGEFIIKGKSSREFVGSDFDSYRNTFIGFIFQEYNILDDFTVGANIALALELQGKKATNEEISAILDQVGLLDFAKRKPNELSGGQKQRVAIARALVKDPQIIMADEPTGALDSNTGKQILDTLKELSKTKLVIIVSHDRDFAERYGDRIIEMKDGRIDSDVTKHAEEATVLSGGVHKMNDGILKIEAGYELTADDLSRINEYLKAQSGDVFISGDRRVNDSVRTAAGITSDGRTSSFKDTTKEDVPVKGYAKDDSKFIRSSLPMKNAVKMGANSLGHKKFRLVLTIFLSLIAFALFGFADTMGSYNKFVAATDSIVDSNIKNASITLGVQRKWYYDGKLQDIYYEHSSFNLEDLAALEEKTGIDFVPVYTGSDPRWGGDISFTSMMKTPGGNIGSGSAYTGTLSGVASVDNDSLAALGFTLVGEMPKSDGEIAITELMYRQLNFTGFENDDLNESVAANALTMNNDGSKNDIIGKHLEINFTDYGYTKTYKITGVVDTLFDYERYAAFIPSDDSQNGAPNESGILEMVLQEEMKNAISYGFHGIGFMAEDAVEILSSSIHYRPTAFLGVGTNGYNFILEAEGPNGRENRSFYRVAKSDVISSLGEIEWLNGKTSLGEKEYLLPKDAIEHLFRVYELDITDALLAAAERATGKAFPEELPPNYYSLVEVLVYFGGVAYVEENFEALKAAHKAHHGSFEGSVCDESDDVLLDKFIYITTQGGYNDTDLPDPYAHYNHSKNSIFNAFLEALGVKNAALYPEGFSENLLYGYFNVSLNNGEPPMRYIHVGELANLLTELYAADEIVRGNVDYMSEAFYDAAISGAGYNLSLEQWQEEGYAGELSAIRYYADYIRNHTYATEDRYDAGRTDNALGEKNYFDFAVEAEDLIQDASGNSTESILSSISLSTEVWDGDSNIKSILGDYTLAGLYSPSESTSYLENMIVSDGLFGKFMSYAEEKGYGYEEYAPHTPGIYAFAIAPMPTDESLIRKLVDMSYDTESPIIFEMQNPVMDTLDGFNDFIEVGATIFMWVGVGFAVFSALMLMNFISVSISYKKREIGILRAVGAKSSDVYKIFFSEAAIIALINYVLALITTIAATVVVNVVVRNEGLNVTLLSFGFRQVILMLAISVAVAAIASFLPVYRIARKKPVDAIKDR